MEGVDLPEGLITTATGFGDGGHQQVLKPTFGTVGSQYVRFRQHFKYCGAASEEQRKEVYASIDVCEIHNDKFTKAVIRVKDLSPKQRVELAQLYERFKTQKDSTETEVISWDAATEMEKALMISVGAYTVESVHATPESEAYKFGPDYKDLKERARRHVERKQGSSRSEEMATELQLVMQHNAELERKLKEAEELYFQSEQAKALAESSKSKKDKGNA